MSKRILVIGDSCRDVHVYCSSDRMCPDKPVPVLKIVDQNDNPGMARNVYRNIKSMVEIQFPISHMAARWFSC